MIVRVILFALLIYFLYRFIFHFLIPVSKVTREMKSKMNEFQNRMQQQGFQTQPQQPAKETAPPKKAGDYIDFEEVK